MQNILNRVISGTDLNEAEAANAIDLIMQGKCSQMQSAALLVALRMKGETAAEVTGAAASMRRHAAFIDAGAPPIVDTCGTGGDGANTFNISTAAAFVAAGAGITVAKHGNRAVSSGCGSADVLAELGFNLDVEPVIMEQSIHENGIGFLFAPKIHPAMAQVMPVRRELKIRTIFNMLGPLTNPAGASGQVLGVFAPELTEMFAIALKNLGCHRAFIVHGHDGLDEITCTTSSRVTQLRNGRITTSEFHPEMLLGQTYSPESIRGGTVSDNAKIILDILSGKNQDGARAVVLLNAAAAIVTGECADDLTSGLNLAKESINSGAALNKMNLLIKASNS